MIYLPNPTTGLFPYLLLTEASTFGGAHGAVSEKVRFHASRCSPCRRCSSGCRTFAPCPQRVGQSGCCVETILRPSGDQGAVKSGNHALGLQQFTARQNHTYRRSSWY